MAAMNRSLLRGASQCALILSLAVPAVLDQAACGGNVILDQQRSSGAGGSGAGGSGGAPSEVGSVGIGGGSSVVVGVGGGVPVGGVGGGTAESCTLRSTTPIDIVDDGCQEDFAVLGPASICSPGPGGELTPDQCAVLCPPSSNGQSVSDCRIADLSTPPDSGVVTCSYGPCGMGG